MTIEGQSITVCIPSIARRSSLLLSRALPSVFSQSTPVSNIAVYTDHKREGAWEARNKTIEMAKTEWIGFLDDDDELLPHHFSTLLGAALEHDADVVWGWFQVVGGTDPFPAHRGRQWDVNDPHIFPITCLVRRELITQSNARFLPDIHGLGDWHSQDFPFWFSLHSVGAKFLAIPDITWKWHHHGSNTSGLGSR